jgi:predicted DNA-binding protein
MTLTKQLVIRLQPELYEYLQEQSRKSYTRIPEYLRQLIVKDMEKTNGATDG